MRPRWMDQKGQFVWRSYTAGLNDAETHIFVELTDGKGGLQSLICLSWGDYGSREEAEELAKFVCEKMNA